MEEGATFYKQSKMSPESFMILGQVVSPSILTNGCKRGYAVFHSPTSIHSIMAQSRHYTGFTSLLKRKPNPIQESHKLGKRASAVDMGKGHPMSETGKMPGFEKVRKHQAVRCASSRFVLLCPFCHQSSMALGNLWIAILSKLTIQRL